MEITDRLTLESAIPPKSQSPESRSPESQSPESRLSDGRQAITVAGKTLEAQLLLSSNQLLVIMTDDRPFEETIRLYLLGGDLTLLDELAVDAPYQSLIVNEVVIIADRVIDLIVNDGVRFRLQVGESPVGYPARLKAKATARRIGRNGLLLLDVNAGD